MNDRVIQWNETEICYGSDEYRTSYSVAIRCNKFIKSFSFECNCSEWYIMDTPTLSKASASPYNMSKAQKMKKYREMIKQYETDDECLECKQKNAER